MPTPNPPCITRKTSHLLSVNNIIQQFPTNLTLRKEHRTWTIVPDPNQSNDHSEPPLALEEWDWGPLMSHCTLSYWECMLSCLQYHTHSGDPSPAFEGSSGCETDGCQDTIRMMTCCIGTLDSACGPCVGTLIEAVATLVPKVRSMLIVMIACNLIS